MNKWLRLAVALAWGSLVVASLYDYHGMWRILPGGIAIVGGFVAVVDNRRRNREADELNTLNLTAH